MCIPGDGWSYDVCENTVQAHRDDLIKFMDADVVADYLVSEGVFSSSDRENIFSADDKCVYLLSKVEDKRAYHDLFSILHQTGPQLPAHKILWDILCDGENTMGRW